MSERWMSWSWDIASYTEILFQDVPRASRVQPEMFYETWTVAFSNLVSNWKLEFWMFLRNHSPRLVFMSFNPYCTRFCRVSEILNERSIKAGGSNHKQQAFSKKDLHCSSTVNILTLNQNATSLYCFTFNMILYITPAKIQHDDGKSRIWRCISHWTWGFSNVILVFPGCND